MSQSPVFDVVIPVHKKDLAILEYCISAAKKNLIGIRNIYVVSKEKHSHNAIWFDEAKFPFSYKDIEDKVGAGNAGWYYQQLLKMYSPFVIENISQNVFILDSDTVFFKKIKLFDEQNRPFYTLSKDAKICRNPFDLRVDKHIKQLLPEIARPLLPEKLREFSGIAHNMMFNREIMADLFARVEKIHGKKFYEAFLDLADNQHSVSEYQTYFNFLAIFYPQKINLRRLKYKNTADINIKKYAIRKKYHYCSFHSYLRQKRENSLKVRFEKFLCKKFKKLFLVQQWNIGIAKCNISEFLSIPNQQINWLKSPCITNFRADPFGIIIGGKKNIIFEKYCFCKRKGEIAAIEIDDNLQIKSEKKVLERPDHLSYPYVFSDDGQNYCIVENHREKEVAIYQIQQDLSLKKLKVIFSNIAIVDPSIVKYEGKFWLFFSPANKDEELHIAFANELSGEWKMHKNNPVKIDISSSRPAGGVFEHKGNFYRPAQNCKNQYGQSIEINKITHLSEDNFSEIKEIEIAPDQLGKYPKGLHNISSLGGDLTLIDGMKNVFVPHKFLLVIFCKIKGLLKL
jgi:hypothetical protein